MTKRKLTENDYNLLLNSSDNDESEDDCSDLDDSLVDGDWQPHLTSDEESSYDEEENDEESLTHVVHDLALEEDGEDSDDEDRASDDDNDATKNRGWTDYVGRHKPFLFSGQESMKTFIPRDCSPGVVFRLLIDDKVIDHIVCETNKYADQEIAKITPKPYSRLKKWSPTNSEGIKQFFGLLLWMGLVGLGSLENY